MRKGWSIAFAGMALNLTLGVLYSWSVFNSQLSKSVADGGYGWTDSMGGWPFTLCIVVWALCMIPAGRLQDTLGPRLIATVGAIMLGCGLFVASFAAPVPEGTNLQALSTWEQIQLAWPALIGFGLLGAGGIGLGYAAATPAAVKWFPATMKGRATGVVVAGMGLASVYIAPLARHLIENYGIVSSFRMLGIAFAVVGVIVSQFIKNPPAGYVPEPDPNAKAHSAAAPASSGKDHGWTYMVRTPIFYLLWLQFVCSTSAGLMVIGKLAKIVVLQSGGVITAASFFVAILAVFNAIGRIASGFLSDRLGSNRTMMLVCTSQFATMLLFPHLSGTTGFVVITAMVGFNYGACLPLFPAICATFWGTRNMGMNYGLLFTAWGVAGAICPMLGGYIFDSTGSYNDAYIIAASLVAIAVLLGFVREKFGSGMSQPLGGEKE